jgi:hypothetical protein
VQTKIRYRTGLSQEGGRGGGVLYSTWILIFQIYEGQIRGKKGDFILESRWINIIQHGNLLKSIDIIILEFVVSAQ